jgi:hypothetical protein
MQSQNPSKLQKYKGLSIALFLVLFISAPFVWHFRHTIKRTIKNNFSQFFKSKNNVCACTWDTLKLNRDNYKTEHLPQAKKVSNNLFVEDKNELKRLVKKGKLIVIDHNEGYKIRRLQNSSKHLTKKGYQRLIEMGKRFKNKLKNTPEKDSFFELSSVLRTEEQQKRIRKLYPNAATLNNSTHSYGVSFDIVYIKSSNCKLSNQALNEVLNEMQAEGKILLCPEKNCIHVTVK